MRETIEAEPEDVWWTDVGWPDERIRKKIQTLFSSYLIGKSASDLVVVAERIAQDTTGPDGEGSSGGGGNVETLCNGCGSQIDNDANSCTNCGRRAGASASAWSMPSFDGYGSGGGSGSGGGDSGGGDYSA